MWSSTGPRGPRPRPGAALRHGGATRYVGPGPRPRGQATPAALAGLVLIGLVTALLALPWGQGPEPRGTAPEPTPRVEASRPDAPAPCAGRITVSDTLVPSCGAWLGVGAVPLHGETYDMAMEEFEDTIGRPVDIAHYYARGQRSVFPLDTMLARAREGNRERILFLNWKPDGLTWRQVADGAADDYLRRVARHIARRHPDPMFLSLNAEMEDEVVPEAGSGRTAEDFADFFRHVVTLLRDNGADNIVTVLNYMGTPRWGAQGWFDDLYPGDKVVDWVAWDPYAFGKAHPWRTDYAGLLNRRDPGEAPDAPGALSWPGFYTWARVNHPDKPLMLAEWGVDDVADDPAYKPRFFRTLAQEIDHYPAVKAFVYWNADSAPVAGTTRVDSSPASLAAFRRLVSMPQLTRPGETYLGRPARLADRG